MVSVWDYLILRAKVRVAIVCSIIFDDHQQEKGASPFSVRNRSFWIDGISVFPPRMDGGHFGKYLSMMENRTQGNHFGRKTNLSFAFARVFWTLIIMP